MLNDKILIAEDDSVIGLDIRKHLENMGFKVSGIVQKGEELLKKAKKEKPALIITDISLMGEMDGIEAIARLDEDFNIPYIFITAYDDYRRVVEIYNLKPLAFIRKPIDYSLLDESLNQSQLKAV